MFSWDEPGYRSHISVSLCHLHVVCVPESGSGPFHLDHPSAVHSVHGSDLGADPGQQFLCSGSSHSGRHRPGLALHEDGTSPVGDT